MGLTTDGYGLARMGTETRDMIPPAPTARDLNYLNQKWEYLSTKKTINIIALARRDLNYLNHKRGYLSTMETIIFNNKNYKHPMARAPRNLNYLNQKCEYLSTKKTINILALARRDLNYLNYKRGYLSTMKTIIFNNGDNENNKHPCAGRRNLNYLNQKQHEL